MCSVAVITRTEKKHVVEVVRTLTTGKEERANSLVQRSFLLSINTLQWNDPPTARGPDAHLSSHGTASAHAGNRDGPGGMHLQPLLSSAKIRLV